MGNEIVVKVAKNKLAPPFRLAHFDMIFGVGIDRMSELVFIQLEFHARLIDCRLTLA